MPSCRHFLPGFRPTCLAVGGLFVLLAGSELARGVPASLDGFGVPAQVLGSAHYQDAMVWVFTHMLVLGLVIGVVGHFAESARTRRAFARVVLASIAVFTVLDLRSADWALGSGLYAGARSLVPPVIDGVVLVLFAHLSWCSAAAATGAAGAGERR
jgi:hypothetical protein